MRDNLLAILANGHQTVAICVALTLYLLARHPSVLEKAKAEVDEFGPESVSQLRYLESVIIESLRVYPAAAGLQLRTIEQDNLDGWSIPAWRAVGVTLMPLHASADYFGEFPQQFRPERYMPDSSGTRCPFHKADRPPLPTGAKAIGDVCLPLTFGAGARRCLGEHFALHEMKVMLATLIRRFDFDAAEGFEPDLDLDRFGLFIALRSINGVNVRVERGRRRPWFQLLQTPLRYSGLAEKTLSSGSEVLKTSSGRPSGPRLLIRRPLAFRRASRSACYRVLGWRVVPYKPGGRAAG